MKKKILIIILILITRPIESELPPRFEGSPNFYPWLRAEDMVFFPSD